MDAELRRRAEALFEAALDLPAAEREGWLAAACAGDAALLALVERLLAAAERDQGVLEAPPERLAAMLEEARSAPAAPERVGPYRLVREIGRGGMGSVHLAQRDDGEFEQTAAVKLMRRGLDADEHLARFRVERQILASLRHPNIASLLDGGLAADGRPYLVMELVEGEPITVYCDRRALPVEARLRLFQQVCRAVQYAHRNLVVHRDLKPSNILVDADGAVKLLDFGIAKLLDPADGRPEAPLTRTGAWVLTPEYAAPEQVRAGRITTATDVYALGLILYELLCGQLPYSLEGRSWAEVERLVCETEPTRPSALLERSDRRRARLRRGVRGDLDNVVLTALAKEPERRYASAEALAEDVQRYLDGHPVAARGSSTAYRVAKFVGRHRWGVAAAAAIVLLLAGSTTVTALQQREIRRALAEARLEATRSERISGFLMSMFEAADPEHSLGDQVTARELLRRGVQQAELLEAEPLVQASMLDAIGRVQQSLGKYAEARPLLERSLAVRRRELGDDHVEVAESHRRLGVLLRLAGEYPAAEEHLATALRLDRARGAEDDPRVAADLHEMGLVLLDRGEVDRAESFLARALELRRRSQDATLAESLMGMAGIAHARKDPAATERYQREALALRERLLGPDHPEVARTRAELAESVGHRGDLAAMEALLERSLASYRRLYGEEHPSIAAALNRLAAAAMDRGDLERAEALFRQATEMRGRLLGPDHPGYLDGLNNLGMMALQRGDLDAADSLFREVVETRRRVQGNRHPSLAAALMNQARVPERRGDLARAEALVRESSGILRAALGPDDRVYAASLFRLGTLRWHQGDPVAADTLLRRALRVGEKLMGPQHLFTTTIRDTLTAVERSRR